MDDLGGADGVEFWRAEARRWRAEATELAGYRAEAQRLTADNLVLRAQVADLQAQVDALVEKVSVLAKLAFGTSSEKATTRAPASEDSATTPAGGLGAAPAGGQGKRGRGQRRGSAGHGRRDYSHLPTREEIHDVPEAERACPRRGAGYAPFGEECCEQIDWQVRLTRIVHRRPTYRRTCRCPVRGVLVAPPVPKAIPKGRFTTGFLARLLVEKFVLGRPTHRIAAGLAHDGLDLADGTLAGVFVACSDPLAPLASAITERNGDSAHLHIDETSWNVYAAVEGKNSHRWWCWVFVGPDTTVFRIAPSRSLKVLTERLGIDIDTDTAVLPDTLPEGRQPLLSSDFYTVYQCLGRIDGVDNLWCWAHIRRYFIRAGDAHPELAAWAGGWVERIAELYVAHTAVAAAEQGSATHRMALAQLSAALNTIDAERRAQTRYPDLLHPAAAKALATRSSGVRTTTAPGRWPPPSWPARSGPSPPPRNGPGSTHCPTYAPTSTSAPEPGAPPPAAKTPAVAAILGGMPYPGDLRVQAHGEMTYLMAGPVKPVPPPSSGNSNTGDGQCQTGCYPVTGTPLPTIWTTATDKRYPPVHPWRTHLQCPGHRGDLTRTSMPVAHHQPPRLIELLGQCIDITVGLGAQGRG